MLSEVFDAFRMFFRSAKALLADEGKSKCKRSKADVGLSGLAAPARNMEKPARAQAYLVGNSA